MDGRRFVVLALLAMGLAGCQRPYAPPFEQWLEPETPYSPSSSTGNAFDGYAFAAKDVEENCGKYLNRNNFTPAMRQKVLDLMSGPLSRLRNASGRKCSFEFRPHKPGEIGRASC